MCMHTYMYLYAHIWLYYWGEPERAPQLMMSTVVLCVCKSSYCKHLPEDELKGTSGITCSLKTANTARNTLTAARRDSLSVGQRNC